MSTRGVRHISVPRRDAPRSDATRSGAAAPLNLPYPSSPFMKNVFNLPIWLHRLGLGPVVGRLFLILTTTGRKSGLPRHTAIEFHERAGRCYVYSGWGDRAQWYKNILADPLVTIQTWRGAQSVVARQVTDDQELGEVFDWMVGDPYLKHIFGLLGIPSTRESFLAHKDHLYLFTFDPTDRLTPSPVPVDLTWVWSVIGTLIGLYFQARAARRRQRRA
jgi:deazaflavin-dependent oxidoreductase (nitroreductase family)